jgi:hypothetical protein
MDATVPIDDAVLCVVPHPNGTYLVIAIVGLGKHLRQSLLRTLPIFQIAFPGTPKSAI